MNRNLVPQVLEPTYLDYPRYSSPIVTHESPETAIARQSPEIAAKLLDRISQREYEAKIGMSLIDLAKTYAKEDDKRKITVQFNPKKRMGFLGLGGKGPAVIVKKK